MERTYPLGGLGGYIEAAPITLPCPLTGQRQAISPPFYAYKYRGSEEEKGGREKKKEEKRQERENRGERGERKKIERGREKEK
jgi:hypothetical protein